ncbi:MAG: S8 family serine peptidase [Candidatus Altimarinota bacterium]
MIKKYFGLVGMGIISGLLAIGVAAPGVMATAYPLFPGEYEVGEEVRLTGDGFGELLEDKFICFNDEQSCFLYDSEAIKYWSDSEIRFLMPQWAKVSGKITIYEGNTVVGEASYTIKPTVYSIKDFNDYETYETFPGEKLILSGKFFGSQQGKITFGILNAEITEWSDSRIVFTVPESSIDILKMKLCRQTICSEYELPLRAFVFNDPFSVYQYYLRVINYNDAFGILTPKKPVIVAVIDDGVYLNHQDLQGRVWTNKAEIKGDEIDNDQNGYVDDYFGYNMMDANNEMTVYGDHGTIVAGIIGAERNNNVGMAGLSTSVQIMPLIACGELECKVPDVIEAIRYAVDNGARIINLSIASIGTSNFTASYDEILEYAYDNNVIVVVAAGNGDVENGRGQNLDLTPQSPVCNDGNNNRLIGVAALDYSGELAEWSNYGDCVDVAVPGEGIIGLDISGADTYSVASGTSFSAPIVAGVLAQVISTYPEMKNTVLMEYLRDSADANDGKLDTAKLFNQIKKTYDGSTQENNSVEYAKRNYFQDVNSFHKNSTAINYLKELGVVEGFPNGTFRPDAEVTRAEMLKILIKGGLGIEPDNSVRAACFNDVKVEDWYSNYVCYAKNQGWASGYGDGNFRPNSPINKVEAMKFLILINKISGDNSVSLPYLDVISGQWYENFVKAAYSLGLLEEKGNMFGVANNITRGGISENIFRLLLMREMNKSKFTEELLEDL